MVPGDVLKWNGFSVQKGTGPDKTRWFIYLGDNGSYTCPAFLFMITATTQLQHYIKGGDRESRRVVRFYPTPASPFDEECLVDVEHDKYEIPREHFNASLSDIIPTGKAISNGKLLEIWRIIEVSKQYSPMVRKDIKRCLVNHGII